MKALRTFIAAVSILTGAALVVAWCGAWLLLTAVDDGVVAGTMARAALSTPAVTDRIGDEITSRTTDSLAEVGIDLSIIGADVALRTAIRDWTSSEEFRQLVLDQVDNAREQLRAELVVKNRAPGPFEVAIDVSDAVNQQVDDIPFVGSQIPDVAVAPVRVEVASADSFSKARTAYSRLDFAKTYFLWIGAALVGLGLAVSTRRRFVIAKFLIAVGTLALLLVGILTLATPARLADRLPGGDEGTWAKLAIEAFHNAALPGMRLTIAIIGLSTLLAGALMATILKSLRASRERYRHSAE